MEGDLVVLLVLAVLDQQLGGNVKCVCIGRAVVLPACCSQRLGSHCPDAFICFSRSISLQKAHKIVSGIIIEEGVPPFADKSFSLLMSLDL
jgi:hypothetical protein